MVVCLSPNGRAISQAGSPATELLVGTIRGVIHFGRTDASQPWKEYRRSLEHVHVSAVLHEPRSGRIFVGGHGRGGLWVSDDDGDTWSDAGHGIEQEHIFHIAAQDRDDGVVMFVGVEPANLYRSDDLGASWQLLPALTKVPGTEKWTFPPPPHLAHAKNVSWHASDPETILVCVEQGALLKSTDGGHSFFEIASYESDRDLWYHDTHRTVIRQRDPRQIFLSSGEGVYYSADGGDTWKHIQTRHDRLGYPDALVIDPHDEDVVFIAGAGNPPREWAGESIANSNAGVIRSDDGGETWYEAMNGLPQPVTGNFEAMSLFGHPGGIELFLGTATGEVYCSPDRGANWSTVAEGLPPVSKVHHYRWFLPPEERHRIEDLARAGG